MKNKYRLAGIVFTILFIASVFLITNFIYSFQDAIAEQLSIQDVNDLHKLRPMMFELGIYTFVQVILGLIAIFLMLLSNRNVKQHEIIYVEKIAEKTKAELEEANQLEGAEKLAAAMLEADNKISKLNKVAAETTEKSVIAEKLVQTLCNEMDAVQGALFLAQQKDNKKLLKMVASYAYFHNGEGIRSYEFGEGLIGQVAKEAKMLYITAIPEGYITVLSGLGNATPGHLLICPILVDGQVEGIIEVASFTEITKAEEKLVSGLADILSELISKKQISSVLLEA